MSLGYTYDQKRNKYQVRVTIDGKRTYIGRYDTPEEAHKAYLCNSPSELETYRVNFETHDNSFDWVKTLHEWQARRKAERVAKKRERENIARVAEQINNM